MKKHYEEKMYQLMQDSKTAPEKELDNKIKTNLNKFNIEYEEVNGCKEGYEYILNLILSK